MKTLSLIINENDYLKYNFEKDKITFSELKEKLNKYIAKEALQECLKIVQTTKLGDMTLDDINDEINAVRDNTKDNN